LKDQLVHINRLTAEDFELFRGRFGLLCHSKFMYRQLRAYIDRLTKTEDSIDLVTRAILKHNFPLASVMSSESNLIEKIFVTRSEKIPAVIMEFQSFPVEANRQSVW
jgi:hypothetical protein